MSHAQADIVVVGGGMAGLILASELVAHNKNVVLLEAGKDMPVGDWRQGGWRDEAFDHVAVESNHDYNIKQSRVKALGGSAEAWEGYSYRLLEEEFSMRSRYKVGYDWPMGYDDLHAYYQEAERLLGVSGDHAEFDRPSDDKAPMPPFPFESYERNITKAAKGSLRFLHVPQARNSVGYARRPACTALGGCNLCPTGARWSPSASLLKKMRRLRRLDLRTNCVATQLEIDDRGRVLGVEAYNKHSRSTDTFFGDVVVIAAGAIDSIRLLLNSQKFSPKLSFSDALGRGFMDHPALRLVVETNWRTSKMKRQTNILASSHDYRRFDVNSMSPGFIINLNSRTPAPAALLAAHMEMLPNKDNSITLSDARDPSGMPLPLLSIDSNRGLQSATVTRARKVLNELALRIGNGNVVENPLQLWACHLMGGARMGYADDGSVVDRDLRVHSLENVFVASLATMPTSSSVNPTLTLAALTLRLRDRIVGNYT